MNNKKLRKLLSSITYYVEVVISVVLLLAVLLLLIELVIKSGIFWLDEKHLDFNQFLSGMFNLIIGVEFTKMLCKHTPDTVVEVLMFAVARQIIVAHNDLWGNVLGVFTLAVLFAIRKFLIDKHDDEKRLS